MAELSDGEWHVMTSSYHLLKAIQSTKNLNDDMISLLGDLDIRLSSMIKLNEDEAGQNREIETRLVSAQQTIMSLHSSHSKIWASNHVSVLEYLQAIADVQRLIKTLESVPFNRYSRSREILDRAQSILQMAMDRLRDELVYILVQNRHCFEHEYGPLPACEENSSRIYEEESIISSEDDSVENASQRDRSSMETDEYVMDLIHPDVVPHIKSIADAMFTSGYGPEFCRTFTAFWTDTLAEYLSNLDLEQLSIVDVLRLEWKSLNSRIRKWRVAVKSIIRVYVTSAKRLLDQVLGEYGQISSTILVEASKAPILRLLNFGQAVSIGPHAPEWLFCLLNMYEALVAVMPDVDALFPQEIGALIRIEFHELLTRLGDSIKAILKQLGNCITSCSSKIPYRSGSIHHLTKYVTNYILCFPEYDDTLDWLLRDGEDFNGGQSMDVEPNPSWAVATYLQSLTSTLEANLENRSSLYGDSPLKHIFMMNNIHYMVQKIRNSKISPYFGDEWIRNHIVKYRQHAMWYERATWSSMLDLLRDDGKTGKATLKARSRAFATCFEELYKNQTRWLVPDLQLREEMRISASRIVIQAYRNFVKKVGNSNGEKHVKYTEQELGTYILDLLEGSPKSLNHILGSNVAKGSRR